MKELNEAKVLAVGPGGFDKDGKRIAMGVKAGDKVLIPQVGCPAFFRLGGWERRGLGLGGLSCEGDKEEVTHLQRVTELRMCGV